MSKVRLMNLYFILKLLALANIYKLYDNKHLLQNYCFLLPPSLFYFLDGFLYFSHLLYLFYPSYSFHPLHLAKSSQIVFSHFWHQELQCYSVDASESLKF